MRRNSGLFSWPTQKQWTENGILKTAFGLALFWGLYGPIFGPIDLYDYAERRARDWWWARYSVFAKERKEQKRIIRLYQEQIIETKPAPLPLARARSLTTDESHIDSRLAELNKFLGSDTGDDGCLLLTVLPPVIRARIWKHVLGGHTIVLLRGNKRLLHVLQDEEGIKEPEYGSGMPDFYNYKLHHKRNFSALLKTNRQIYKETVSLLYTHNTFSLWQNDTLADFQSTTLPRRFNSVSSLTLHWQFRGWPFDRDACGVLEEDDEAPWDRKTWEQACKVLQSMAGLQDLFVFLRGRAEANSDVIAALEYLRNVEVSKDRFKVRVPWPRLIARTKNDALDRRFEDRRFPFHVFRPEEVAPDSFSGLDWVEHPPS